MIRKKRNTQKNARKSPPTKKRAAARAPARSAHLWSARVTKTSDALDLKSHLFDQDDPAKIAQSLKRSAERSKRRKGTPFQSAMSMLNFYINRAGKNLPARRRQTLDRTKDALRQAFGR